MSDRIIHLVKKATLWYSPALQISLNKNSTHYFKYLCPKEGIHSWECEIYDVPCGCLLYNV